MNEYASYSLMNIWTINNPSLWSYDENNINGLQDKAESDYNLSVFYAFIEPTSAVT